MCMLAIQAMYTCGEVLIGCALFLAPVLKFLPQAVLQGIFFYMGIASLTGNNLFDRLWLWLMWEPKRLGEWQNSPVFEEF